jgi:HSP20 family protein
MPGSRWRPVPVAASGGENLPAEKTTMKTLTRWSPLRELETLQDRLSTLFERAMPRASGESSFGFTDWTPAVDVSEDEKEYLIKAELPEVKKEDVKVTVENGTLRITGERKFEKEEKDKKYHRIERAYGSFERTFALPEDAKADAVAAEFKEGVLKVHLPKSEQAKPKPLEIKVS